MSDKREVVSREQQTRLSELRTQAERLENRLLAYRSVGPDVTQAEKDCLAELGRIGAEITQLTEVSDDGR